MITRFEDLGQVRTSHESERIVLAIGAYDILHQGHVEGLRYRRDLGELLVVGVLTDEQLSRRKGPSRPIQNEQARLSIVEALKPVDYAYLLPSVERNGPSALMQTVKALHPDIFTSLAVDDFWRYEREAIEALGTQYAYDPLPKVDSTTDIVNRMLLGS